MAASKIALVFVAAMLVAGAQAAMNTDRTLTTAGAQCLDKFNALIKANYKGDATCADLIRTAMSTADPAKCPKGSADPKSDVQACLAKDATTSAAWVDFVKTCEVLNVANRAGEAEAATERKPSCFPPFSSVDDFRNYLAGNGAKAASAAAPARTAAWLLAAAGAAAALAL